VAAILKIIVIVTMMMNSGTLLDVKGVWCDIVGRRRMIGLFERIIFTRTLCRRKVCGGRECDMELWKSPRERLCRLKERGGVFI
jgi:hypothetical protein